jgi:hypothetical protein
MAQDKFMKNYYPVGREYVLSRPKIISKSLSTYREYTLLYISINDHINVLN